MKQTKATFRNKSFISLKGSILFLILISMTTSLVHAQYTIGTTGQLMIPTAEMQETGTFWVELISYPNRSLLRFSVSLP